MRDNNGWNLELVKTFTKDLLHVKKDYLDFGLIESQTEIDLLAIKLHFGNKRSDFELKDIINVHEEISYWDSGLLWNATIDCSNIKYWNSV